MSDLIAEMTAAGYKAWTIRAVLTPLSRILGQGGDVAGRPRERGEAVRIQLVRLGQIERRDLAEPPLVLEVPRGITGDVDRGAVAVPLDDPAKGALERI